MTNTTKLIGIAGLILLIAGHLKTYMHTNSLSPMAASYCGNTPPPAGMFEVQGHCWGCISMPIGIVLLAIAAFLFFKGKSA